MDDAWTEKEFISADLGDVRLNKRLMTISQRFAQSPLSPINHACDDWAETKAAYRFFSNDKIEYHEITKSHIAATKERCAQQRTVLAIQDTSYFTYAQHPKTKGLCSLVRKTGHNGPDKDVLGLIMHSTFAVDTDGLPLGIVHQKIYSRPQTAEEIKGKQRKHHRYLPIQDKDSYRWLESLENTSQTLAGIQSHIVTICDREADNYDFFLLAQQLSASLVVRAAHNRMVNKESSWSKTTGEKLWGLLKSERSKTTIHVQIPKQDNQAERTAVCDVKFTNFVLHRPQNSVEGDLKNPPPSLTLYAVYVSERDCPAGCEPLDWMLITNVPVKDRKQALEIVSWYCLRWRIETWHKVLKSGLKVEDCRLSTNERLYRYIAIMSIVAWRIFWITLVGRAAPEASCRLLLNEFECKILMAKFNRSGTNNKQPPTLSRTIRWIAQLGGFLARKSDKEPGITHIWRGLKKFTAMLDGAELAKEICG
jgi:hypothetical protein